MNKTILLVDYEQKSIDDIEQLFKDEPFDLLTALDGNQALEVFEEKAPDLVITSALLPKLNGFELCKKIVSGQHGDVRPVIMFSGIYKAEKYRKEAIVGCGAVDFLEKPLTKWQLLRVVKGLFSEIPGGARSEPLDLKSDRETLGHVVTSTRPTSEAQSFVLSDDLLNVEPLLSPGPVNSPSHSAATESTEILDTVTSGAVVVNSFVQELEAAVDAVRTDLDSASRLRDRKIAEEIESQLSQEGQNILEIDLAKEVGADKSQHGNEGKVIDVIDLEDPATPSRVAPTIQTSGAEPAPQFSLAAQQSKSWPLIAAILVGVLILLCLWLRS
jgi:PleD family two-component response regulator